MPSLTSTEQAKLERALALAHRHVWAAMVLYAARDDYQHADDLGQMTDGLYELLEAELKRGRRLRTR